MSAVYPPGARVVPFGTNEPQPMPSMRTDRVARGWQTTASTRSACTGGQGRDPRQEARDALRVPGHLE
jgi:hypothetical protein